MSSNKTALVLGGGGARGAYEIGVWQGLREMGISIDILAGTSVGAINGAMIVQNSFELAVKLWHEMQTDMVLAPGLHKKEDGPLQDLLAKYVDEKAIRASTVEYGLVTVELPSIRPRYFFKEDIPQGKMADYILASASLFPAIRAKDIDQTKYVDGGYLDNLPVDLALQKGATHVIAVDLSSAGILRKEPLRQADHLIYLHCHWDLGNILVFDGTHATRNIRLGYLDLLRAYGFYDGTLYAFAKGTMPRRNLSSAEAAGKLFLLDPTLLYSSEVFHGKLHSSVLAYRKETERDLMEFQSQIKALHLNRQALIKLLKKVNQRTLTVLLLDYLKEHPVERSALLSRSILALFKDEAMAAYYLFRQGLG